MNEVKLLSKVRITDIDGVIAKPKGYPKEMENYTCFFVYGKKPADTKAVYTVLYVVDNETVFIVDTKKNTGYFVKTSCVELVHKYRAYEDTEEMIEDFNARYGKYDKSTEHNPLYCPCIWVRRKGTKNTQLITAYNEIVVQIEDLCVSCYELYSYYEYLDGTVIGKDDFYV